MGESVSKFQPISLAEIPADVRLIHCAATISNNRECLINNASIDSLVFDTCISKNLSVVYCSTNNVYPLAQNCTPDSRVYGSDYYSVSKLCGEHLFRSRLNINAIILRIGDVFGTGQRHGNLFKAIESSISNHHPLKLFGKGLKVRSFIHIEELVRLIRFLSDELASGRVIEKLVNGSLHEAVSVREIVEYVAGKTDLEVTRVAQPNDTSEQDVRSMVPFIHSEYAPKFSSFWDSLDHYINSCLTTREHSK
ncbi:MAG: NAD-dependent epimerase/dehydratase family protein [Pirellula sp.]|nr:NAD-dependent epimerase/dehydratase family protein [Pirellula sp.]